MDNTARYEKEFEERQSVAPWASVCGHAHMLICVHLNLISHLPIRSYVEQQSLMMMQQFTDADDDDDDGNDDDDDKVSVMEFERSTMLPQITKTM